MTDAIFYWMVYGWIALAIIIFFVLQFITAPFGRHSHNRFGAMMNARWAWCLMEIPSPLVFSIFFLSGDNPPTTASWLFFICWNIHYFNRSLIYPFRQKALKKKMPIAVMASAVFFNCMNGFFNGYYFGQVADLSLYQDSYWTSPMLLLGLPLFILGMAINWQSDNILLGLRKPGETGYKIPYGGLFKYVSCPNLMGELLEWTGFAIMVWASPAFSFAVWTYANLVPRALAHHRWYLQKFGDRYPQKRKAVIPFLW